MITGRNLICLTLIPLILLLIPFLSNNYVIGQIQSSVNGVQITPLYSYFNSNYNVSMNYPSTWSVNETDPTPEDRVDLIAEFVSPFETLNDTYTEYVQLNRDDGIFYVADLNKYLQESISSYQDSVSNFTLIDSSTSDYLSDQPAYSLTFTQVLNGEGGQKPITLKCFEIGTLINNTGYYITYIGQDDQFERFFPIVKQMINSFKIILSPSYNGSLMSFNSSDLDLNSSILSSHFTSPLENSTSGFDETTLHSTGFNSSSSIPILSNNLDNRQIGLENGTSGSTLNNKVLDPIIISPFNNTLSSNNTNDDTNVTRLNGSTTIGEKDNLQVEMSQNNTLEKSKVAHIEIRPSDGNKLKEAEFNPREIVVDIGTMVFWTNNQSSVHTVTSVNNNTVENNIITSTTRGAPLFDSDYMNTGDKFFYNFTQPGRFDYYDKNNEDLKGTVFVKQAPKQIISNQAINTSSLTSQITENSAAKNIEFPSSDNNTASSLNNKTGSLDNLTNTGNNPNTASKEGTLSQLIHSLRQMING